MHGIILTGASTMLNNAPQFKRTGGAHRIATYLRDRNWDVEVLDFVMGWNLDQLKEFTRSRLNSKSVFVGFGGTFPIWSDTLEKYFSWLKQEYPEIKIIAGGQISNIYKINADWYVDGFGERALEELLKHITGSSSEKLKYQLGINGRKILKGNLDYPSFPMSELHIRYEDRDFIMPDETLVTELGRGCIFNCAFCNFPILGVKEDHSRSAENFRMELQDTYDRFGVTKYVIADETVNDYTAKLEKFAGAARQLTFRPRLFGFARGDLLVARKQDWDIMLELGFTGHHYGIESANPASLKVIGKGMHPDKLLPGLLEARNYFKKHSIYKGQVSLIVGLPYETRETLNSTLKWFESNWKKENLQMFPLYIPKADGADNASKFSNDWGKYGFRKTAIDLYPAVKTLFRSIPTQYGVGDNFLEDTGISWETDEWNLIDACKIVADFYLNDYTKNYGPVIWNYGDLESVFNKPYDFFIDKTISEIFDNTGCNDFTDFYTASTIRINDYITKKLNWTPS